MVDYLDPVLRSSVTFQYRVVDHVQRQRRPVIRLIVEIRGDSLVVENRADNILLRKRRYFFRGL